jgi:hypothetical protein
MKQRRLVQHEDPNMIDDATGDRLWVDDDNYTPPSDKDDPKIFIGKVRPS